MLAHYIPAIPYEIAEKLADFIITIGLYMRAYLTSVLYLLGIFLWYPREIAKFFALNELIYKLDNKKGIQVV